jgi:sialate O-acetylesterase
MSASRLAAAAVLGCLMMSTSASAALLNPVFQDHAVLQRDQPVRVWGSAAPGATVTVGISGSSVQAHADGYGRWSASLPAMVAGGPYSLTAQSNGQTQTVTDVLVGDVYLCSGQSNMVMAVKDAIDSGPDVQVSTNDSIRLMSVANVTAMAPQATLPKPVTWAAANPATVPNFSATCYFFGRELEKSVHVPVGLIQSAWNGIGIQSLMSEGALRKAGGEDVRLDALKLYASDPVAGMKHWGDLVEDWWRKHLGSTPWTDPASSATWPTAPQGLGIWSEWKIASLEHFSGNIWFRTQVTLTADQAAQEAQLSLGTVTEEDQTWVNGRFVASTFGYGQPRHYTLAPGALHAGMNDILINVFCGWRGCGMFGPPDARAVKLRDGSSVPLAGPWRYQVVPSTVGASPRVPWGSTAGVTTAYNAMIAPLAPYNLRGVVWYQGESNTGDPDAYRGLLKAWMADWRGVFQSPTLPFLIAQLPDYGLPLSQPEDASWAHLRESQRLAVAEDPNTALAVNIDIGDHMGLHPSNKQEVGRRLSLAARRLIYHDARVTSGPVPLSATRGKGVVTIAFAGVYSKLETVSSDEPIGFELCGSSQTTCRFAPATIVGTSVQLAVPRGFTATRVRYCWGNGPVCTLYDAAKIPAVPFELALAAEPARAAPAHPAPKKHPAPKLKHKRHHG